MTLSTSLASQRLLSALRDYGCAVRETSGDTTMAQCPSHQDDKPSLSISQRRDGKGVILHCHAGCSYRDILSKLNLRDADLFDDTELNKALAPTNSYLYSSGREKRRQLDPDGTKSFFWTGTGKDNTLYAVDRLGDAKVVYLCEGEKAVDFLRALGHAAVATGGANRTDCDFTPLTGRHVLMVVDRDDAGMNWARKCTAKLQPIAATVNAMQSRAGIPSADVVEHVAAGFQLSEMEPVNLQSTNGSTPHEPLGRQLKWLAGNQVQTAVPIWAWHYRGRGRIQLGTLALFAGRPGAGKSSGARWFAAMASQGELDGYWEGNPQHVAYIAAEESLKYTTVPGLQAAGADMSHIHFPTAYRDGHPTQILSTLDEIQLTEYMIHNRVTVVIVDPLISTVTTTTDVNRTNEVRNQIVPWARIADNIDGITIGVVHLRKNNSNVDVVAAINGSSAFGEVPRSIFAFAKMSHSEDRVMSQHKNSTGSEDLALSYEIRNHQLLTDDGRMADIGVFTVTGDSAFTVEDIFAEGIQTSGAGSECRNWLEDFLSVEGPIASRTVKQEAMKTGGWAHATVERAANKLKVISTSSGFPRTTTWRLPTQSPHQSPHQSP